MAMPNYATPDSGMIWEPPINTSNWGTAQIPTSYSRPPVTPRRSSGYVPPTPSAIPGQSPGTPTTYNTTWQNFWNGLQGDTIGQKWNDYYGALPAWQKDAIDNDPQTGWGMYTTMASKGLGQNFQRWLGNNFTKYYSQYNTAPGGDPTVWWGHYLGQINPYTDFSMADPISRGERQNLLTNTMRMVR